MQKRESTKHILQHHGSNLENGRLMVVRISTVP